MLNNLPLMDKPEEACGVFGVFAPDETDVAQMTYYGLYALQHRGQESAGISVSLNNQITTYKGLGLTSEVFKEEQLRKLVGNIAVGHVRYSTCGDDRVENAQPLEGRFKLGQIAIAHNGNLVNAQALRELLEETGVLFHTSTDSEVIVNMIARKTSKLSLIDGIKQTLSVIQGSYALIASCQGQLIGVRDPHGIRPLCLGKMDNGIYILASESCALDAVGAKLVRDILPGEIIVIDADGIISQQFAAPVSCRKCSFEHIYFARPDSIIDNIDVYWFRHKCGMLLAEQCAVEADIVIGVPDSGMPAAIGYSEKSGIPFGLGLIKNKYIGRTFIHPTQELREQAVRVKLNPLASTIKGKRVIIVDDSLVRGTTSKRLVEILRTAGAKEVHFKVASPPVKFPCYFGINTPTRKELLANNYNGRNSICKAIGADTIDYITDENLIKAFGSAECCFGCFDGKYPVYAPMEVE